jgi:hypothetical protein
MNEIVLAAGIIGTVAAFGAALLLLRHRAYRRLVTFNPKQNCRLGVAGPKIKSISASWHEDGFLLQEPMHDAASALLEVEVRASLVGRVSDPAIEIRCGRYNDVQYFERGVRGVRFLNVSRLFASNSARGELVQLKGRGVKWRAQRGAWHLCREKVSSDDRVLVVAPHPDSRGRYRSL